MKHLLLFALLLLSPLACGSDEVDAVLDGGLLSPDAQVDAGPLPEPDAGPDAGVSVECAFATYFRADAPLPYGPVTYTSTSVSVLCDLLVFGAPSPQTLIGGDVSHFFGAPRGEGFWVESLNAPDIVGGPETSTVTALVPAGFSPGEWSMLEPDCYAAELDVWIVTASITPDQEVSRGTARVWTRPDRHAAGDCPGL